LDTRDQLCWGCTLHELDCHTGVLVRIRSEQFAQKASSHGWLNADAQPASLRSPCLTGHSGRPLKLLKGFTSLPEKIGAYMRKLEAAATPLKQRRTKGVFELPQSTTDRGVPNSKRFGGTSEAPAFSNDEGPTD
jgi:hypothetical protein